MAASSRGSGTTSSALVGASMAIAAASVRSMASDISVASLRAAGAFRSSRASRTSRASPAPFALRDLACAASRSGALLLDFASLLEAPILADVEDVLPALLLAVAMRIIQTERRARGQSESAAKMRNRAARVSSATEKSPDTGCPFRPRRAPTINGSRSLDECAIRWDCGIRQESPGMRGSCCPTRPRVVYPPARRGRSGGGKVSVTSPWNHG